MIINWWRNGGGVGNSFLRTLLVEGKGASIYFFIYIVLLFFLYMFMSFDKKFHKNVFIFKKIFVCWFDFLITI